MRKSNFVERVHYPVKMNLHILNTKESNTLLKYCF